MTARSPPARPRTLAAPALPAVVLLLCAALAPAPAEAWGRTGHRVSGALAERWLTPEARAGVTALLGSESLARASTWADEMRSSPDPFWQEQAGAWHYVTVPPGRTWAEVGPPPEGDAVTALRRFRAEVVDPDQPIEVRRRALRFLIHIVGDLHQPLHVGNGRDRGGNDVEVRWFGAPSDLHRVWDTQLVDQEQLAYTEWAQWLAAEVDPERFVREATPDPEVWIAESAALRARIYPQEPELGWDYAWKHRDALRERLTLAGIRLAAVLNDLFAP